MAQQISVDSMVTLLKGMQREKMCLQEKLKESQVKKQLFQSQMRQYNIKYNQAKETNVKQRQTLNVAQAKLDKSQKELKSFQEDIDKRRHFVENLKIEIQRDNEEQMNRNVDFQNRLSAMADRFIAARQFYNENNLKEQLENSHGDKSRFEKEANKVLTETDGLAEKLKALSLKKGVVGKDVHAEISIDIQNELANALKRKSINDNETMVRLRDRIAKVQNEVVHMTK